MIVSESVDGVNVADDVAPVITLAPSNTLWSPVELFVPKSPNLSCWKYNKLLVESHSTTLPTAPVVACVIFSSTSNVPLEDEALTTKVCLRVEAVATVDVP